MRSSLKKYEKEQQISLSIRKFRNGLNFVEDYDGTQDVMFLDIEMPHMGGMSAAMRIREKDQDLMCLRINWGR